MAHYPLKCVKCAHIATNDTVLFDTDSNNKDIAQMMAGSNLTANKMEQEQKTERANSARTWWDNDDDEEEQFEKAESQARDAAAQSGGLPRRLTYPDMLIYCRDHGLEAPQPEWKKVRVTKDFAGHDREPEDCDLLMGFSFQKTPGGERFRANQRYCPMCGNELPKQSGSMPTYVITVMGASGAGKTVYLCALNWVLKRGGMLPYDGMLQGSLTGRSRQDIDQFSSELFEQGRLPGTTQQLLTEPLVMQISFVLPKWGEKECLFALSDMRGEDMTDEDGRNLEAKSLFFSRADGFMLLISPRNIPMLASRLEDTPGQMDIDANTQIHNALMQNVNNFILTSFDDGKITAPSVIMLSMCDLLIRNAQRLQDDLRIDGSNAVIRNAGGERYCRPYFAAQYDGTSEILKLDPPLYMFLNRVFRTSYYTSFSSLGDKTKIEQDDSGNLRVKGYNLINPLRVVDPILFLLISLGFLPEYDQIDPRSSGNEEVLRLWQNTRTQYVEEKKKQDKPENPENQGPFTKIKITDLLS